ncbi:polycystic kidney disease protein 1-like 1 [Sturnira hondurensis]|uniref:polycystic kidney disease protein 1-like 1 n=1 Tax=Sturnira hondurensis TaxID=192404 RepID=UPI001879C053|nr:polycystic kidney disease protein 1-like 1 [Sturnira hondurensis]
MGPGCSLLASALALLTLLPSAPGSHSDEGGLKGSWPAGCQGCDLLTPGKISTSTLRAQEPARGLPGNQERSPQEAPFEITSCWSSGGPGPHRHLTCVVGEADGTIQHSCPMGPCSLKVAAPSCAVGPPRSTEDEARKWLPRMDVTSATVSVGTPIMVAVHAQTSTPVSQSTILPRSPYSPLLRLLHTRSPITSQPGGEQLQPCAHCHPRPLLAPGPEDVAGPVIHRSPQAPLRLGFRIQMAPGGDLCLVMDFGDGSGVQMRVHRTPREVAVTTYHQYRTGGVYALKVAVHTESPGAALRLGPYFLAMGRAGAAVTMNASSVHRGQVLAFGSSPTGLRSTVVMHRLSPTSSCNVSFSSQALRGGSLAWTRVTIQYQMQPVSVYTNGTVFATDTDVTFVAVTEETTPLDFTWLFGDAGPVRTTRRTISRRLGVPQGYRVVVQASNGLSSVASEPHHVQAQRRVVANRLVSSSWALVGDVVAFECRLSFGTDVAYHWDFGDGTGGLGNSSASHVYSREGEVVVRVLAFNAVSASSLTKHLFVVRQPCQPPPVRSPVPGKVQVWRSQPVTLGVTLEATMLCDNAQGLSYTWTFTNSTGWQVPLPPAVHAHGQTLTVPSYSLEPGNYTALAKVQVEGSTVHSNYCVEVEVRSRAPVSVISEGTHLFVPRTPSSTVVLRGSLSYDPDRPGAALRYRWTCSPASTPGRPCFSGPTAQSLDTGAPTLSFQAGFLSSSYDQFLVTLTVSSHGRSSSAAQVFLSILSDSALRLVSISWVTFRGVPMNWNEGFSLSAACEDCGKATTLSYSWGLFQVNATGRDREEVPFCRTVGLLGSSGLGAGLKSSESHPPSLGPSRAELHVTTVLSLRELWPQTLSRRELSALGRDSAESTDPVHRIPATGDAVAPDGGPWDVRTPVNSTPPLPDFEAHYSDIQEAAPAEGRWPADWTHLHLPAPGPSAGADESHGDGDNLLGPFLPTRSTGPALLVDWPKSPVSQAVFHGYTVSGATGQMVTVKPYSLSPGATYVLQATVASGLSFLGKAQLYLTINPAPRDVACQVQPPHGLEAHTVFSVFCTSGRPDFRYEFSYLAGNTAKRTLYRGTDSQYYFSLPAGVPGDGHQVLVSTVITDGEGSQAQPCATAVTVLPHHHGALCPGEDMYNSSLKYLSTLQLMGSPAGVRNYISVTTSMLSRWAKGGSPSCGLWPRIQGALISAACTSASRDQEEIADWVLVLGDLLCFPNKLSLASADHILRYVRSLLAPRQPFTSFLADSGQVRELVLLVAGVLQGMDHKPSRGTARLLEEGVQVISDTLLGCLLAGCQHRLHISARQMEFHSQLHRRTGSSTLGLGPVQVQLPADLATPETQSLCYISQLTLFRGSPTPWGHTPGQVGTVLALSLHHCSSGRPLRTQRLRTPITVEFGEEDSLDGSGNKMAFVLLRDRVNVHHLVGLSTGTPESLQIRVEFSKPDARAFPVMLLVRFSKKPTPSHFLVKQTHSWEGLTAHVSVPATSLRGPIQGYLSLLDADYNRDPADKHLAKAVSYTLRVQGIHCLHWDARQWAPASLPPQLGTSPGKVSCSYDHPATAFSMARRDLNATFETDAVSELRGHPTNPLPGTVVAVCAFLYVLLVMKGKRMDHRERRRTGYVLPEEHIPPGHQLYAVVVDTGFRAPAHLTAKVYIVLCGDDGLSEPRELYCPGKPLFERNSRHTFILSTPAPLGPLRKVRLWHDSRGASPSWYVSHVMVQELHAGWGLGRSWFFPAECWLAACRQDGLVERELACLRGGLGFWKLLYSKFTELLEDFHVWASVHTRPAGRGLLYTPRLSVAFVLLCTYTCLTAMVTTAGYKQLPPAASPTGVPLRFFWTGFLCTLLASPGAQLLSLLFRLSQQNASAALSRATEALSAASSDGAGHLPPDLEARGNYFGHRALRERSGHCILSSQAPTCAFEGLATSREPPAWLGLAAWTICGVVSVACALGTGFLGYRFSPTLCEQWLGLLAVSVTCCAFITQPLMIGLMALGFAWKRRGDENFFTKSLQEATKGLDADLEGLFHSQASHVPSGCDPHGAGTVESVLAARQQVRRLRWARPPPPAQLRVTRERMRRQTRAREVLRDAGLSALMLLLHLCVTHGEAPWEERALHRAIRDTFTRSTRSSMGGLGSVDAWWTWSLSTLLDGLYPESGPAATGTWSKQVGFPPLLTTHRGAGPSTAHPLSSLRPLPTGFPRSLHVLGGWGLGTGRGPPTEPVGLWLQMPHAVTQEHGPLGTAESKLLRWKHQLCGAECPMRAPRVMGSASSSLQPGALGGKCYLLGPPVLQQLKAPPESPCELPGPLSALTEDPLPACHPETPSMTDAQVQRVAPSASEACGEGCELPLGRTSVTPGRCKVHTQPRRYQGWCPCDMIAETAGVGGHSGPRCQEPAGPGLGASPLHHVHSHSCMLCRPAALTALTSLRARQWVNHSTSAVSVRFTLYNPPTCLFASVSLSAKLDRARSLALSAQVESVSIFHSDSTPRFHLLLPQLALLVLTLTHLCLQLHGLAEKGVCGYWRRPRNWLEVAPLFCLHVLTAMEAVVGSCRGTCSLGSKPRQCLGGAEIGYLPAPRGLGAAACPQARLTPSLCTRQLPIAGAGLAWYAACGRLLSLMAETTNQLQQGLLPGSVDLSLVASWAQRARWLQGALSFLLALRCLRLLVWQSATASRSLSGVFAPVLAGVLVLAAHSHLRGVLLFAWAPPSGTSVDTFHRLLFGFPGSGQKDTFPGLPKSHLRAASGCCVGLLAAGTALWFALVRALPWTPRSLGQLRGSFRAFTPKRKSFRRLSLVTLGDVTAYAWEQARSALGLARPVLEEEEEEEGPARSHACPLDEFAGLLDELLLRVEGLANSPQLPLEEWPDVPVAGAEGSPLVAASDGQVIGVSAGKCTFINFLQVLSQTPSPSQEESPTKMRPWCGRDHQHKCGEQWPPVMAEQDTQVRPENDAADQWRPDVPRMDVHMGKAPSPRPEAEAQALEQRCKKSCEDLRVEARRALHTGTHCYTALESPHPLGGCSRSPTSQTPRLWQHHPKFHVAHPCGTSLPGVPFPTDTVALARCPPS